MKTILLTGGTGYIGSHTAVELMQHGYRVILVDNCANSAPDMVDRIEKIVGQRPVFFHADVTDGTAMEKIFSAYHMDAVIHFAGYKSVGESVRKPIPYYRKNIDATLPLWEVMAAHNVNCFVFSSSATVYGAEAPIPYREDAVTGSCMNPYGWTKYMIEQILRDAAAANASLSVMLLRYFNPIGAHESGLIGERPAGVPNNLLPYITQVAAGQLKELSVFGDDYPTPDGTGVRDYIHIVDLAKGHMAALDYALGHTGVETVNLGTGQGYSVLEVLRTFERVNQVSVPYRIVGRRAGDLPVCYADTEKAEKLLHWHAEKSLEDMCRDSWRWQQNL